MNKQGESDRILPVTSDCFLVMEYITFFCNFPGQKVVVVACCCPVRGVHVHVHVHVSVHTPVTVRSCSVWSEQPGSHELLLLTTGSHRAVHTCLPPPEGPQVRHTTAQINRWLGGVTSPQREDEDVGPMSTLCDVLQFLRLGLGAATVKSRGKLHFVAKHFADVAAVEN